MRQIVWLLEQGADEKKRNAGSPSPSLRELMKKGQTQTEHIIIQILLPCRCFFLVILSLMGLKTARFTHWTNKPAAQSESLNGVIQLNGV